MTLAVAGAISVPHNLGADPSRFEVVLECLSADLSWSTGDIMYPTKRGLVAFTATNMLINEVIAATVTLPDKGTGSNGAIDDAKWNIIIRAWR